MGLSAEKFKNIVVLTGAGISADSGVATFRDSHGLWEKHRIEDVATPEAFEKDPALVWKFYSLRRMDAARALPNAAHLALVEFARRHPGKLTVITQNVDCLHERADSTGTVPLIPMHGTLKTSRCSHCDLIYYDDFSYFEAGGAKLTRTDLCTPEERMREDYVHHFGIKYKDGLPLSPCCSKLLRPNIVWFGEIPHFMPKIEKALGECDLFVSIGTSGQVYPAAGFLQFAKSVGAKTALLNKEEIGSSAWVDHLILGSAKDIVPEFFKD